LIVDPTGHASKQLDRESWGHKVAQALLFLPDPTVWQESFFLKKKIMICYNPSEKNIQDMGNLTDIRTGTVVKVNGDPYLVTQNQFMRKDASKPVMRTKLRNLITGNSLDKTFLAGESFEFADIERRKCQYLYSAGSSAHLMDNESFDQFDLDLEGVGDTLDFLKDDTEVYVTFYEGNAIGLQPPIKVTLEVTSTIPGVKGDTAQGGTKPATVETGATVSVPLFVKEGDKIVINTDTKEYDSRAKE